MDALEDSILDQSIDGDAGKQTHEPAASAFELDLDPEDQGSAGAAEENPD